MSDRTCTGRVNSREPSSPGNPGRFITESRVSYPDNSVWHAVDVFHFRDGKIRTQVAYFAPTVEAADWRARWVERF
jgi:hypothetical protein